jgi:hypothetical protein
MDCPVCSKEHPTGRYTQTIAGLRHRSRECAEVAQRASVDVFNVHEMAARLRGVKESMEGRASWCVRCGVLMVDAEGPLCAKDAEFWADHDA